MSDSPESNLTDKKYSRRDFFKLTGAAAATALASSLPSFSEHAHAQEGAGTEDPVKAAELGEKTFDIELLGTPDNPFTQQQTEEHRRLLNESLPGIPYVDEDSIKITLGVFPDAYRQHPENFGYDDDSLRFYTNHINYLDRLLFNAGLRDPYSGDAMPVQLTRLIVMEKRDTFYMTPSFIPDYMVQNYKDAYGTISYNWLSDDYSRNPRDYVDDFGNGDLINVGWVHEACHMALGLPDIYAQDFVGQKDPTLHDVHPSIRDYTARIVLRSVGGSLMGDVTPRMDPYAVWLLMNRKVESNSQILNETRYDDMYEYRTRVARGDTLEITALNESLPPGIATVDVYRSAAQPLAADASLPDMQTLANRILANHDHKAKIAVAENERQLIPLQTGVAWNPDSSKTFTINHPWGDYVSESDDPQNIRIKPEDSLCAMIFRDADGKAIAMRYIPVTDLTVGQSFDISDHKHTQRLGMHVRDFNADPNEFGAFDSNIGRGWEDLDMRIVYYDGKPFCGDDEPGCVPTDPPTTQPPLTNQTIYPEPTPEPTPDPQPTPEPTPDPGDNSGTEKTYIPSTKK